MKNRINGFLKISLRILLLAMAFCLPIPALCITRTSPFLTQIGEQAAASLKQPQAFAQVIKKQKETQELRAIVARMADRAQAEKEERESKNTILGVNKNVVTVMGVGGGLIAIGATGIAWQYFFPPFPAPWQNRRLVLQERQDLIEDITRYRVTNSRKLPEVLRIGNNKWRSGSRRDFDATLRYEAYFNAWQKKDLTGLDLTLVSIGYKNLSKAN